MYMKNISYLFVVYSWDYWLCILDKSFGLEMWYHTTKSCIFASLANSTALRTRTLSTTGWLHLILAPKLIISPRHPGIRYPPIFNFGMRSRLHFKSTWINTLKFIELKALRPCIPNTMPRKLAPFRWKSAPIFLPAWVALAVKWVSSPQKIPRGIDLRKHLGKVYGRSV